MNSPRCGVRAEGPRSRGRTVRIVLLSIVLSLAAGAVLYYMLCPDVIFVKYIDSLLSIERQPQPALAAGTAVRLVRNYLLDFLWAYSLALSVTLILSGTRGQYFTAAGICTGLAVILEVLQYRGVCRGTFDIADIIVEGSAIFIGIAIHILIIRGEKE